MVCSTGRTVGGGSMRVGLTAGGGVGSVTEAWSMDGVELSGAWKVNGPGTGGSLLTVAGSGLGSMAWSEVGGRAGTAWEGTEWMSETMVVCEVGSGGRGSGIVVVSVGSAVGSMSESYSYDEARLVGRLDNRRSDGSGMVTAVGSGLGSGGITSGARLGWTSCEATEWASDSMI
eukprot:1560837-Rhodomonas_salina.1